MTDTLLRRTPVQQRSSRRLEQIENAGRQILRDVGRDRLTTALVAELAGCSIGTFYRYFEDRVALLDSIQPLRVANTVTELDQVTILPRGTVLLCRMDEVFWLPPAPQESAGDPAPRLWLAAGYDPAGYVWADEQLLYWAPLTILHIGAETWYAPTDRSDN